MTRKLVLRPARGKRPRHTEYPWDDYEEYVIIPELSVPDEVETPTGILDAYGIMIMKPKEPIGYTHF